MASTWCLRKLDLQNSHGHLWKESLNQQPKTQAWWFLHPTLLPALEMTVLTSIKTGVLAAVCFQLDRFVRKPVQNDSPILADPGGWQLSFHRWAGAWAPLRSLELCKLATRRVPCLGELIPCPPVPLCPGLEKEAGTTVRHHLLQPRFSCQLCFGAHGKVKLLFAHKV